MNTDVNLIKTQENNIDLINDLTDKKLQKIHENSLKKKKRSSVNYNIEGSKISENGTITSKTNMNISIEKTIKALDLATNEAAAEIVEATADAADAAASSTINLANRIVNKNKQNNIKDLDKHKKDLIESVAEAAVATATAARVAAKISRIGSKLNGDPEDIKNYITEDDSTTEILRKRLNSIANEDSSSDEMNLEIINKETRQIYDLNEKKDNVNNNKRDIGVDISGTVNDKNFEKLETEIKELNEKIDKCVTKDELNNEFVNKIDENISNNKIITEIKSNIEKHQEYIQNMGEFVDEYEHILPDLSKYYEKTNNNTKKIDECIDYYKNYSVSKITEIENKINNCVTKDSLNDEITNKINENETIKTLQNNSQNYITKEYFETTLTTVVTNLTNSLQQSSLTTIITTMTNTINEIITTLNTYNTQFTEITNQITENNKTYDSKISDLDSRISESNTKLLNQVIVDMSEVHKTNSEYINSMTTLQKEYETKINSLISEANSKLDEEINKKLTSIIDSKIEISIKNRSILAEDCIEFLTKHYAGNLLKITSDNVYIRPC